jgi:UDP-N-acetylmuramoylalanine--D-glutamate ligase
MTPESEQPVTNERVLVLGMGATGASCARYLARRGVSAIFADTRTVPTGIVDIRRAMPEAEVHTGCMPAEIPEAVSRLVVSPGLPVETPLIQLARQQGVEVLSDIDLFIAECTQPLLAVTGSNGKSTVASMVAAILDAAGRRVGAGGNLGPPALDLLEFNADVYVLELSSFQLERSRELPAAAAVILNIAPDHLDQHVTEERYTAAKARIYRACQTAVVNRDAPAAMALAPAATARLSFGMDTPSAGQWGIRMVDTREFIARGADSVVAVDQLPLIGRHNLANALAACAMADALEVPTAAMQQGLLAFHGLPHRMQTVPTADGICWIDDSKATNEAATIASIGSVTGPLVLIAGGDAKGAAFSQLATALAERECTVVLPSLAAPGSTVLLAPACGSQDMFADYADRGRQFTAAVRELAR